MKVTKKKEACKSSECAEQLTTKRLCDIWEKIRSDAQGGRALRRLDEAGFRISHSTPTDATFRRPSWADYIAALPLLPNKPSTRRIHSKINLRKYRLLVQELRTIAAKLNMPFVEVTILSSKDYPDSTLSTLRDDLLQALGSNPLSSPSEMSRQPSRSWQSSEDPALADCVNKSKTPPNGPAVVPSRRSLPEREIDFAELEWYGPPVRTRARNWGSGQVASEVTEFLRMPQGGRIFRKAR